VHVKKPSWRNFRRKSRLGFKVSSITCTESRPECTAFQHFWSISEKAY